MPLDQAIIARFDAENASADYAVKNPSRIFYIFGELLGAVGVLKKTHQSFDVIGNIFKQKHDIVFFIFTLCLYFMLFFKGE